MTERSALYPQRRGVSHGVDTEALFEFVHGDVVGGSAPIAGPFGPRSLVYADTTATGRSLKSFEGYIQEEVMPTYGNTHTVSSACGIQSTFFLDEARGLVHDAVHGTDDDVVLFVGNGCTAAIQRLARLLDLQPQAHTRPGARLKCQFPGCHRTSAESGSYRLHARTHTDGEWAALKVDEAGLEAQPEPESAPATTTREQDNAPSGSHPSAVIDRPVVLVGPMEHHSNLLVWRESQAEVVEVDAMPCGRIDQDHLRALLARFKERALVIGSFCAASNVTGIVESVNEVTVLLHEHDALAFWDYAAAAPHCQLNMNPRVEGIDSKLLAKDAVFLSPHKFLGGPGTPGLLIVKKSVFRNEVPSLPGGGTVFYVTSRAHRYVESYEQREEGGTPDILGAVRCGLVFHLHQSIGEAALHKREQAHLAKVLSRWVAHPHIQVLGDTKALRHPIVSFMVPFKESGRFLHWNFVVTLLSDLFGVQARGGCVCAGPYGHRLLRLGEAAADAIEAELLEQQEMMRPGWIRASFSYHMPPEEVDFVVDAVEFVADHGWKLLPQYTFEPDTGHWSHRALNKGHPFRRWLHNISFAKGGLAYPRRQADVEEPNLSHAQVFERARAIVDEAEREGRRASRRAAGVDQASLFSESANNLGLRWFVLPSEVRTEFGGDEGAGRESGATGRGVEDAAETEEEGVLRESTVLLPAFGKPQETAATVAAVGASCPLILMRGARDAEEPPGPPEPISTVEAWPEVLEDDAEEKGAGSKVAVDAAPATNGVAQHTDAAVEPPPIAVEAPAPEKAPAAPAPKAKPQPKPTPAAAPGTSRAAPARQLFPKVAPKIVGQAATAIREFDMIRDGDRVLIGLSGGKDSMTMLHVLRRLQRKAPIKFDLGAVTMDPQFPGFDPSPLIPYMKELGIPYFFQSEALMDLARDTNPRSICAWCSRMKRGILYSVARREGYNVLVLAQHADDLAESFLMSCFHNGRLRTMKASYVNDTGDIRIIRPFIYVRERQTREWADKAQLPIVSENCPACFEGPKERYRIKKLIAQQEHLFPSLVGNLLRAMKPLMTEDLFDPLGRRDGRGHLVKPDKKKPPPNNKLRARKKGAAAAADAGAGPARAADGSVASDPDGAGGDGTAEDALRFQAYHVR